MRFVTAGSVNVVYTIPPLRAHQSDAARYHLEIKNIEAGTEVIVNNPTVVPAVGPNMSSSGTPGSVTFTGVSVPNPGLHVAKVMYANSVDLDGNAVSLTMVSRDTFNKVVPVTTFSL